MDSHPAWLMPIRAFLVLEWLELQSRFDRDAVIRFGRAPSRRCTGSGGFRSGQAERMIASLLAEIGR